LVGFPETQEQMEKFKAHGLHFDKIIHLRDMSPLPEDADETPENMKEQEPGTEIKARMAGVEFYDYEAEVEASTKVYGLAGEHLGAELASEIHCNGTPETVLIRIRKEIDPFYLKKDSPDVCKVTDLEGYKGMPKGDFGEYCPVTYVDDGWLVRGSPENEVIINGKTYWFADPKEAKRFSFNPSVYLKTLQGQAKIPLEPPKPKIMIMGNRGAGTSTLIRMLCDKFRLDEFQLKQQFLKKQNEEKEKRKRGRLLNKGFAPPAGVDEETGKPIPDPDVENEPEGFNPEDNDIEVMRMIMDSSKGLVIDGSWRKVNEDDKMDPEAFEKLLVGSRRVPEIIVILRCAEESTHKRLIAFEAIKAEYDRLMEVRAQERARVRAEERKKEEERLRAEAAEKAESGEVVDVDGLLAEWDATQDAAEKAADEEGGEGKPNLEEMINV
jgi:adenylate/nucleoside-diphosphate kinase